MVKKNKRIIKGFSKKIGIILLGTIMATTPINSNANKSLENKNLAQEQQNETDLEKYFKTLKYVGDVTTSTNIIDIIIEGHSSSDEIKRITNGYDKKDILFLYNRRNIDELSYQRSYNVFLSITNGDTSKLTNYGLYDLVNEYEDIKKNRRVEFILIENTNDMNIYTNYINKLIMSNL